MSGRELDLESFLRADFDPSSFTHREHVRMAFETLRRHDFIQAALHYTEALQAMAQKRGTPQLYHMTITIAFLSLISERLETGDYQDFDAFAAANPDLMDRSALARWYRPEQLAHNVARRTFVLPEPAR